MNNLYASSLIAAALCMAQAAAAQTLSRGIGRYPGNPDEYFAPQMVPVQKECNLALHRPARASSAFDFCLTPQLVTDGITTAAAPPRLVVKANGTLLPRREREWAIDGGVYTRNTVTGSRATLQYEWSGARLHASRVHLECVVAFDSTRTDGNYAFRLLAHKPGGGQKWTLAARRQGKGLPGTESYRRMSSDPNKQSAADTGTLPARIIKVDLPLDAKAADFDGMRLELDMAGAAYWTVYAIDVYDAQQRIDTPLLAASRFASVWMSAGGGEEWVEVDLGRRQTFSKVELDWVDKALEGRIETSDDRRHWATAALLPGGNALADVVPTPNAAARYVRVVMTRPTKARRYTLAEMRVMGNGGYEAVPHPEAGMQGTRYVMDGGDWRLQRASEVHATGEQIAQPGFPTDGWIAATVPGTVLTSYVNIGALPDPNVADNIECASESFFNHDFWYRREFSVPARLVGKHLFLNFDGINWKADIYLNGQKINRAEGAFARSRTDVTDLLRPGTNVLAVRVLPPAHPGGTKQKTLATTDINGGMLGADNPTFHASVGWDWISTIRGRETGIWNDVYITAEGSVSLADPLVTTTLALPDTAATITPRVLLTNNEPRAVSGTLRGWVGSVKFERRVSIAPGAGQEVVFSPDSLPVLRRLSLPLWWPNGYGSPVLHDAGFEFVADGGVEASLRYKAGLRQMEYRGADERLELFVNGKRLVPRGGNWGFSEQNLLYRKREYDIAVGYHRDMNFNMIRNWVGQTADEEFFDACDRNGIMVWQDFWLANPVDGPDPADNRMFMANAADFTMRMRSHPCIALYCGRNEGYPPESLDKPLRSLVARANPGMLYISSSADDGVSGHGPYWACPAKEYFARQTGKLHSERGMPNVMTYEGLRRTMSPDSIWPQSREWGLHDFTLGGAQRGSSFNDMVRRAFGDAGSASRFCSLAQWVNYDGYRAMFESGSASRQGLLIWMSHACWPSMVWQCYDYWLEPTAAYYGCRKACEPLHVQWNALTRNVEVVNTSAQPQQNLTATLTVTDMYGKPLSTASARLSCATDTTVVLPQLHVPEAVAAADGGVFFVRLSLAAADGTRMSDNFYVDSAVPGCLTALNSLPEAQVEARAGRSGTKAQLTIANNGTVPLMMARLCLKAADGDEILPVHYSDNYFHLMPGERRTVSVEWSSADARRSEPCIVLEAFNLKPRTLKMQAAED